MIEPSVWPKCCDEIYLANMYSLKIMTDLMFLTAIDVP